MKIFIATIFSILLTTSAWAVLTNQYVPVIKNGAANPPTTQNGSIIDTGTSSGFGNVGIGSTAPRQALDVQGTVQATSFIAGSGTASITGSGANVGIGSANPSQLLDVQGTVKSLGVVLTSNVPGTTTNTLYNNAGTLNFNGSAVGGGLWNTVNTNDVTELNGSTYGNVGIGTSLTTASSLTILKNGSQPYLFVNSSSGGGGNVFTVTNAGNVGINSTTPGQVLDVQGTIRTSAALIVSGSGITNFASGNIGINSASPAYLLDVQGTVRALTGFVGPNGNAGVTNVATTTCGCKTYTGGICTQLGTCS